LLAIRAARRGAVLAGIAYVVVGGSMLALGTLPNQVSLVALAVGLPGVALLGAGLAPAALGSRTDAVMTGIALAIGAPVAAVTSVVIGALVLSVLVPGQDLAGPILRSGVLAAISVAPIVAIASATWVVGVRRTGRLVTARTLNEVPHSDGMSGPAT